MRSDDGYILTGGAGSRMGANKASLQIGTSTFVERIAEALSPVTDHVFTVGGPGGFSGLEHVADRPLSSGTGGPDRKSSITGLYSALCHARTEWIFVVACDMPFVTTELFEIMSRLISDEYDAIAPVDADGVIQPLCSLYRVGACIGSVEQAISEDRRSIWRLLSQANVLHLPFELLMPFAGSELFFVNVNTPEDYAAAVTEFEAGAIGPGRSAI